jgi:hypothetical protein
VSSSPSSVIAVPKVVNEAIVHDQAVVERTISTADRWLRTVRTSESMVVSMSIYWYHCVTRHHRRARMHPHAQSWTSTPIAGDQGRVAPRAWYSVTATKAIANHLIAPPRPLHHFDCLTICKSAIALRTSVRRCDESLVRLTVRAAEKVGKEATGL